MSDFDPGPGWCEVSVSDGWANAGGAQTLTLHDRTSIRRAWVREVPVPALPTTPHTVIRATWAPGGVGAVQETYVRTDALGDWCNVNTGVRHHSSELRAGITAWEVLSEPRAVTAQAVLDRVRKEWMKSGGELRDLATVAREFGVES